MIGLRRFFSPNEHGWLSYGITIQGKLYSQLNQLKVEVEKVTINQGVDYAQRVKQEGE